VETSDFPYKTTFWNDGSPIGPPHPRTSTSMSRLWVAALSAYLQRSRCTTQTRLSESPSLRPSTLASAQAAADRAWPLRSCTASAASPEYSAGKKRAGRPGISLTKQAPSETSSLASPWPASINAVR
jgi:hypothetical protein